MRSYVSVHALPVALQMDPASLVTLIHLLATAAPEGEGTNGAATVAAIVCLLRAARQLQVGALLEEY